MHDNAGDQSGDTTTQMPTFAPPPRVRAQLRRSRSDKVLGGVASGFGRWIGIDPVVIRVVLVVLAIFGGSGILLYAIGWLFIPLEGEQRSEVEQFIDRHRNDGEKAKFPPLLIIPAVIVGVIVLGSVFSAGPWGGWWSSGGWLLLLACGGIVIWLMNRNGLVGESASQATTAPASDPGQASSAADASGTGFAHGGAGDYPTYVAPVSEPIPPRPPRPRSYLGAATLSLAIIVVGVLSALSLADVYTIQPVAILAAGLGVLGPFGGSLHHSGHVQLVDPAGNPANDVVYYDAKPWPEYPGGGGSSLSCALDVHQRRRDGRLLVGHRRRRLIPLLGREHGGRVVGGAQAPADLQVVPLVLVVGDQERVVLELEALDGRGAGDGGLDHGALDADLALCVQLVIFCLGRCCRF